MFCCNSNYLKFFYSRFDRLLDFRCFDYCLRFCVNIVGNNICIDKMFKFNIFSSFLKDRNIIFKKFFYYEYTTQVNRFDFELDYLNCYFNFDYCVNYKDFICFLLFFSNFISCFSLFLKTKGSGDFLFFIKHLGMFLNDSEFVKLFVANRKNRFVFFYDKFNNRVEINKKLVFNIKKEYLSVINYLINNSYFIKEIKNINVLNKFIFNYLLFNKEDIVKLDPYNFLFLKKINLFKMFSGFNNISFYNINNLLCKLNNKNRFEDCLSNFIFGQKNQLIKFSTVEINNIFNGIVVNNIKPLGSWIICGPSGTGKTETAKIISRLLYNNNKVKFVKFDMSEFMERHTVSRLIGSPPGYVGYEKGGELTNFVKDNDYCVILFDEAEKADKHVYDVLLQTLDEGILTDSIGNKVKFNKTVLIFTSNIGYDCVDSDNKFYNLKVINNLRKFFRIEFLNRLDDIVVFDNLNIFSILKVFDKYFFNINCLNCNIDKFKLILSLIFYRSKLSTRKIVNLINKIIINKVRNYKIIVDIGNKSLLYNIK